MPKPKYLRTLAHIFGDPLLENTGLEGGNLGNALALMQEIIKDLLCKKFPTETGILTKIHDKITRCLHYLSLLEQDRKDNGQRAYTIISADIRALQEDDWLLIPGGWHKRTKSGHAMLFLLLPNNEWVTINTGAGTEYHSNEAQPHEIQVHFLKIRLANKEFLLDVAH